MELLITGITSLKIWLMIFGGFVFFSYFPITILGSIVLSGIMCKFTIPPAKAEDVQGFFGAQFRPSLNINDDIPIEEQPGITVKSRLMLMKSPQLTSTPINNTHDKKKGSGGDGPLVIVGHRAAGLDAPENSLSAIRECKKRGCEAVEFDVSLTKDKIPVLFHDDNLIRIAGIDRDIKDMTWEEIEKIDISRMHPLGDKFRNERIPSFEEGVNLCLNLGIKFIVDLKDDDPTVIDAVVTLFQKYNMYSMGVVSSFYAKAIYDIRRRDPNIIGCMAWRPAYYRFRTWNSNWQGLEPRYKSWYMDSAAIVMDCLNGWGIRNLYWWFLGLSAILYHKDAITREETYRWMNKGIRIYVWTVNIPLEKLNFVQNLQLGYLTDTLDGGEVNTVTSLQTSSSSVTPSPILRS